MLNSKGILAQILDNCFVLRVIFVLAHLKDHVLLGLRFLRSWQLKVLRGDHPLIHIRRPIAHRRRFHFRVNRTILNISPCLKGASHLVMMLRAHTIITTFIWILVWQYIIISVFFEQFRLILHLVGILVTVFEPIVEVVTEFFKDVHIVAQVLRFLLCFGVNISNVTVFQWLTIFYVKRPAILTVDFAIALFKLAFLA